MQNAAAAPIRHRHRRRRRRADAEGAGAPQVQPAQHAHRHGLSYLFDAGLFALYALAGTTTFATAIIYGICGVTSTLVFLVLSETGFNDRFADHYLTIAAEVSASSTIMLGGVYFAPEVGFAFCLSFHRLRLRDPAHELAWQASILWTYATIGLTAAMLL